MILMYFWKRYSKNILSSGDILINARSLWSLMRGIIFNWRLLFVKKQVLVTFHMVKTRLFKRKCCQIMEGKCRETRAPINSGWGGN